MRYGTYIGSREDLTGERALIQFTAEPDKVLAQFDDADGYTHGWYDFQLADFQLDPETNWNEENDHG